MGGGQLGVPGTFWLDELGRAVSDYQGHGVQKAWPLRYDEVVPTFPGHGVVGPLGAPDVVDEFMRWWVPNRDLYARHGPEWPFEVPHGHVNVESLDEWCAISKGSHGIHMVDAIGLSEVTAVWGNLFWLALLVC